MNGTIAEAPEQETGSRRHQFEVDLVHELRGPLQCAAHGLEVVRRSQGEPLSAATGLELIERGLRRLTDTLNSMLELHCAEQGKLRPNVHPLDLKEVADGAAETIADLIQERGHQLTVRIAPGAREIQADEELLRRVLINLLHNAVKYTEPGGGIAVTAEPCGAEIEIRVSDNGIGIKREMLNRIFDRYAQAEPAGGGLGIGLALVHKLVGLHGGSVRAFSAGLGQGSEFVVRLPTDAAREMDVGVAVRNHAHSN